MNYMERFFMCQILVLFPNPDPNRKQAGLTKALLFIPKELFVHFPLKYQKNSLKILKKPV